MENLSKNVRNLKTPEKLIYDYDEYYLNIKDFMELFFKFMFLTILISIAFYNSYVLIIVLLPICLIIPFYSKNDLIKKRKNILLNQFKDFLRTLQSFLDASYSIENCFYLSIKEVIMLHGKDSYMAVELEDMCKKIKINKPIEIVFKDFANKTKIDDIIDFSEVFIIAKKNGGNLNKNIKNTISIINDKIEVENDINLSTAEKQFEQNIMNLLPFLIIIYLNFTSQEFLYSLYHTILGRIIMTALLIVYFIAVSLSKKILTIEV